MRRLYLLAAVVGLAAAVAAAGPQPPGPAPSPPPAAQPAPWANKFFLKDIFDNREQPPPPAILHSFGEVPHGTLCAHTFTVTNVYDEPMQVTDIRKSSHALDFVPLTKVLQPNEAGEFTVTLNTAKFVGAATHTVYVTFGPKYISTAVLKVTAVSKTDLTVSPGAVAFGAVAQGVRASQGVKLEYKGSMRGWKLTEVVPPAGPLDVGFAETARGGVLRGGAEYLVTVALKPGAAVGPISERVTVKTNDPANPQVQITVTGAVVAPLDLTSARVRFAGDDALGGSVRVGVRAARPFRLLRVDGQGDGVTAELPPAGPPLPFHTLTVRFDRTKPGAVSRELKLKTDLDGGAVAVLPVEVEAGP